MSDTGKPFGPFELFDVIADTPLGIVYHALRTADGQAVEVFQLDRRIPTDADYLERFFRQAEAAGQISHPNLTAVSGAGEFGGRYYLATEATGGGTVGDQMRATGPLPESKAVGIARDCALALRTIWSAAQLTHGALSVEEIRLQPGGVVKLAGWALARSPEGSLVGDMQALGGALYQMLVNEPPPPLDRSIADLAEKQPGIGPFVTEVIDKMRQSAAWNYTGYDPLIEDLEALLDQRQPRNTQVALSLGAASAPREAAASAGYWNVTTPPPPGGPRRRAASGLGSLLKSALILLVAGGIGWGAWEYFHRAGADLLPLPPAPATPREPITLASAGPKTPPAFAEIADPIERGRAVAKSVGAPRLQPQFGGALNVQGDGQVKWSYAFRKKAELNDFSEGASLLPGGALCLQRSRVEFKCPLCSDLTLTVEGRVVEADPNTPWRALGIAWHQSAKSERGFVLTGAAAELYETVAGQRVVLDTKPFELKPGTPVHYYITQRGKEGVIKLRDGPLLMGTFTQPAEGALRLVSDGCVSAYTLLEITGTVPAGRLPQAEP